MRDVAARVPTRLVGQIVNKIGFKGGWTRGTLEHDCVMVFRWPDDEANYALRCQALADYAAEDGDSGGPVFTNGGDEIIGMHVGRTEFDANRLSVISPIDGIERDHGSLNTRGAQNIVRSNVGHDDSLAQAGGS